MDLELLKEHWNNCVDHCCIFGRIVHICSRYYLIRRRYDRQEREIAIAAWRWRWDFVDRKANKLQKKTVLELLKRHWGVSIVVYSVIWTNPFDHLSTYANREWINVVSTRSTGFRTNKRYAILLEFLGDLCPAGFCLSMIPFISQGHPSSIFEKYLFGRRFKI